MPLPQEQKRYTYQDYMTWPGDERWELIDGIPYSMSPGASGQHQRIVIELLSIINTALRGKDCIPYTAPMDVILSEQDVVQPDIFVVCHEEQVPEGGYHGIPTLIVEVLSKSTERKDRWEKRNLYEKYGVREYLLVSVGGRFVERYILQENGKYDTGEVFGDKDVLKLHSLEGLEIELERVFMF